MKTSALINPRRERRCLQKIWLVPLVLGLNAFGQGTAFTYHGQLTASGEAADGLYDFRAQVYNRAIPGQAGDALVSGTLTPSGVKVTQGMFVLNLDFGSGPFTGEARWLSLEVRTNGGAAYALLAPRQPITATPYAILSGNITGQVPAGQISGSVSTATLPTGGNWALNTTLTLDGGTLSVDPVNNRVGIGTATPGFPLAIRGPHGVLNIESTGSGQGSVIELRGTNSPTYLGAINFNNLAATYPGQIMYLASDTFSFRTAGSTHMNLGPSGRLDVWSSGSRGVYAESTDAGGVGVFGFTGPTGTSSAGNSGGVVGQSAQANGNGVVGVANLGASAYGVWGTSAAGYGGVFTGGQYGISASSSGGIAGRFNNTVVIESDSTIPKPHLRLHELPDGDFARLEFQAADRPIWHIAVGGGAANLMNFYNTVNGDVMSLSEAGILSVKVLTITGGADIAEPFRATESDIPEGSVMVIDENNPGHLKLSTSAYDTRVAGVVSGAGGVQPGLSLRQKGIVEGQLQVALTGRVYVRTDAKYGAVKPGDLLTTSNTPGHAMKVSNSLRGQGAVLGKAMTSLESGQGLVLVLVTLQ